MEVQRHSLVQQIAPLCIAGSAFVLQSAVLVFGSAVPIVGAALVANIALMILYNVANDVQHDENCCLLKHVIKEIVIDVSLYMCIPFGKSLIIAVAVAICAVVSCDPKKDMKAHMKDVLRIIQRIVLQRLAPCFAFYCSAAIFTRWQISPSGNHLQPLIATVVSAPLIYWGISFCYSALEFWKQRRLAHA